MVRKFKLVIKSTVEDDIENIKDFVLGGSYVVFFKEDRRSMTRYVYYVKPTRTDYERNCFE